MQKGTYRKEIEKAMHNLKCVKAASMNGITAEMLKYGGETTVKWMCLICGLAWRQTNTRMEEGNYCAPA